MYYICPVIKSSNDGHDFKRNWAAKNEFRCTKCLIIAHGNYYSSTELECKFLEKSVDK